MDEKEILEEAKKVREIFYKFKGHESSVDTILDHAYNGLKLLNTFSSQEKKVEFLDGINDLTILKGFLHGADRAVRGKEKIFLNHKIHEILKAPN